MRIALVLLMFLGFSHSALAGVPLCKTKENVVASVLIGKWRLDESLTKHLIPAFNHGLYAVVFEEDDSAAELFDHSALDGRCAYAAGRMSFRKMMKNSGEKVVLESPFILSVDMGNPALYFDEDGNAEEGIQDLHRIFLMAAKGKKPSLDILFIGGDHNNQPMGALVRSK